MRKNIFFKIILILCFIGCQQKQLSEYTAPIEQEQQIPQLIPHPGITVGEDNFKKIIALVKKGKVGSSYYDKQLALNVSLYTLYFKQGQDSVALSAYQKEDQAIETISVMRVEKNGPVLICSINNKTVDYPKDGGLEEVKRIYDDLLKLQ